MNFNWCIWMGLLVVLALGVKENSGIPAIRSPSQRVLEDCFMDDVSMQPGECKTLDECPEMQRDNVYPKTCYFIQKEQYVCCPKVKSSVNTTSLPSSITSLPIEETTTNSFLEQLLEDQSPSEQECDLNQKKKTAVVDEIPFMAALGWLPIPHVSPWYRCGGAVISNKYILTAAHCAEIKGTFPRVVMVGGLELDDYNIKNLKIKRFISHPDYKKPSIYNDIALVELEEPLQDFTVACLWTSQELPSKNVTPLGYAHMPYWGYPDYTVLKPKLNVVSQQFCSGYYNSSGDVAPNGILDSHLCANDPEELRGTCQGDTGGPLIMETFVGGIKRKHLVGITSYEIGCPGVQPSIYTRVSSYIDWIESIVWPRTS